MYALIENNNFVREVNLKTDYPHISFPFPVLPQHLPSGVVEVTVNNPPMMGVFEVAEQQPPTYNATNSRWEVNYTVRPMTTEEKAVKEPAYIQQCIAAVQQHLDAFAQERKYYDMMSLCTYATSGNPTFAAEGQRGVDLRDQVWAVCYQILDDYQTGTREAPSVPQLLSELPVLTWA